MNKGITLALVAAVLAVGLVAYTSMNREDVSVNKISTLSPNEQKDAAFEASQATSTDSTIGAIEADLNSTVIIDEDFSDLE